MSDMSFIDFWISMQVMSRLRKFWYELGVLKWERCYQNNSINLFTHKFGINRGKHWNLIFCKNINSELQVIMCWYLMYCIIRYKMNLLYPWKALKRNIFRFLLGMIYHIILLSHSYKLMKKFMRTLKLNSECSLSI